MKRVPSSIGYKLPSGCIADDKLHDEIMAGVDDSALRLTSARRAVEKLGIMPSEAEALFNVTFPETAPLSHPPSER